MNQYIIYAWDGQDKKAAERRRSARPGHFRQASLLKKSGNFLTGGAMLNDKMEMVGSMMLVQFENQEELEAWLKIEPYILGEVWKKWEWHLFRVADVP